MPESEMVLVEVKGELSVSRVLTSHNAELCYLKPGNYCLVEIDNPIMEGGPKWYVLSYDLAVGAPREYWENPNRGIVFESPKRTKFARTPDKQKPGYAYRQYKVSKAKTPSGQATEQKLAP